MKKTDATKLLGGTPKEAASALRITYQAYSQWPEELPDRLEDRVQAAIARKHLPADLFLVDFSAKQPKQSESKTTQEMRRETDLGYRQPANSKSIGQ